MRIACTPLGEADFAFALDQIDTWRIAQRPWGDDDPEHCGGTLRHRIGHSADQRVWAFAALEHDVPAALQSESQVTLALQDGLEFMLFDPPVQDEGQITQLMFELHDDLHSRQTFGVEAAKQILEYFEFATARAVAEIFPEAPEGWLEYRADIGHGFALSENGGITPEVFKAFECHEIDQMLMAVCSERGWLITVGYGLVTTNTIPLLRWELDWPLSRRGKSKPTKRALGVGDDFPWDSAANRELMRVYQDVPPWGMFGTPDAFAKPTVRLRVGGRTQKEAIANWHQCAKALRKRKRRLVIPKGNPLSWEDEGGWYPHAAVEPRVEAAAASHCPLPASVRPAWEATE